MKKTKSKTKKIYEVLDVARFVINYGNEHDMFISNLKLQKILYFIQLQFLLNDQKRPCFAENIEAWAFGPVVPEVFREFKGYMSFEIPPVKTYWDLSHGLWYAEKKEYVTKISPEDQKTIIAVVEKCHRYSNTELGNIACNQTPWMQAKGKKNTVISVNSMIEFLSKGENLSQLPTH